MAEGLATGTPFPFALDILKHRLNEFVLVHDEQILEATRFLWDLQHVMAEPSGAVAVAAADQERGRLVGKRVVFVFRGSNATRNQLVKWLAESKRSKRH